MHPKEKPNTNYLEMQAEMKFQIRKRRLETENKQNTAEYNLKSLTNQYPSALEHTNLKLEPTSYPDPFIKQDEHKPNRTYKMNSPMYVNFPTIISLGRWSLRTTTLIKWDSSPVRCKVVVKRWDSQQ